MTSWMVVYTNRSRNYLDVARVWEHEKDQYCLASVRNFESEIQAAIYARKLSLENGIPLSTEPYASEYLHILDLEEEYE